MTLKFNKPPVAGGPPLPSLSSAWFQGRMVWALGGLVLAIWVAVATSLWYDYQVVQNNAQRNAKNLVRVIEAQVHGQVEGIDLALVALTRALPQLPGRSVPLDPQVHALLKDLLAKTASARAMWVIDAQGNSVHDSDNRPPSFNYAHRDYFIQQRDNPQLGLYVGQPIANNKGVWFVSVSRRITLADGSFGGVVAAALEPRHFEKVFATVDVGQHGNLTLLSTEYHLIARQPVAEALRGQSMRGKTPLSSLLPHSPEGVYRSPSVVDGLDRTFAYRVVEGYPLVVVAGLSQAEVLQPWWRIAAITLVATALLTALLAALGWRVVRELRTSRTLHTNLRSSTERTEAAFVELQGILDAIPDLMFEVDAQGRIHGYKGQRDELLYAPESVFLGKLFSDVLPETVAQVVLQAINEARQQGVSAGASYELDLPSGRRWFELSIAAKGARDAPDARFIVLARDITERMQVRQALEASNLQLARSNTDLEQFAYAASHDLLEPLRSVASSVQLLQKRYQGQLDERADTYIAHAVGGAKRMQTLIQDLLSFSRLSTHGEALAAVPLGAVLTTACENLQAAITDTAAQITHDPLPVVQGDAGQLSHLFQNLMANALKFRGDKPAVVHISARKDDTHWVISVADQGIGIAPQHFERIFGIFKRLHTREEYAGNGIGLTLCQRIVERHGGRIWVESELGQGTTFSFSLSVTPPPPPCYEKSSFSRRFYGG